MERTRRDSEQKEVREVQISVSRKQPYDKLLSLRNLRAREWETFYILLNNHKQASTFHLELRQLVRSGVGNNFYREEEEKDRW